MAAIDPIMIMVTAITEAIINLFFSSGLVSAQSNIHTHVYNHAIKTILKHTDEELLILLLL
jgi:hypothetical protein